MITLFMQRAEDILGTASARITGRLSEKISPAIHSLQKIVDEIIAKASIAGLLLLAIIFLVGQL